MRFGNQTDILTCPDEQVKKFDFDSADTDFVLVVQKTDTIREINDRTDSRVLGLDSHKPIGRGVSDWTGIMDSLSEETIMLPLDLSNTQLWIWEPTSEFSQIPRYRYGYLPQSWSDLTPSEKEKQQANMTTTTHYEKSLQVEVTERVEGIFRAIAEEALEDEIEEVFSKCLLECIRQYEGIAVNEIQHIILKEKVSPESAEVTLRIVGDIDHEPTYGYRRWLLEKALLYCSSPVVRDGANIGLSYMNDPHAIPFFKKAIQKERNFLLQRVMNKTLIQLEDKQKCQSYCTVQSLTNG
ncbi:MAG: hypothetical protein FVQ84_09745 [Planctomycetes bacterium]|nr:hypothetical protein [Planctomycetota bacterium]